MTERVVFIHLPGECEAVPAGRLSLVEDGIRLQASRFAYGRRYVARSRAIAVDPVSLPLERDDDGIERVPVNGLPMFGAIRDATPDAWGRRVIESRLEAPPNGLPESAYLDHAGANRVGALDVRAGVDSLPSPGLLPGIVDLDHLVEAAGRVEEGEPVPAHLDLLFASSPPLGGARPKALVTDGGKEWIAKFPARGDRIDVPAVERATLELARAAGLRVPATRLVALADGRRVMLIERFDRDAEKPGHRCHVASALTMLGKHESESSDSHYWEIADALSKFGVGGCIAADREELYGRMVFNILVSNNDDHLRNHAFVHDGDAAGWRLSPLYDVVPNAQLARERNLHLSVGPLGRAARLDNALRAGGRYGLLPPAAAAIIARVVAAVRPWRDIFENEGVSLADCDRIASAFPRAADIGMREVEKHLKV